MQATLESDRGQHDPLVAHKKILLSTKQGKKAVASFNIMDKNAWTIRISGE